MIELSEKQKNRLLKLAETFKEGDFALLRHFAELEDRLDGEVASANDTANEALSVAKETNKQEGPTGQQGNRGEQGGRGESGKDGVNGRNGKDGKNGLDGRDALDGENGRDGATGKDGSSDTGEQLIDKINEAEGLIKMEKVEGLSDELKKISSKPSGGFGGRRVFQPKRDNFTGDGVTRIFTLARETIDTDTVMVWCTDSPIILKPVTDFTISRKTLTFSNLFPAPSNGATIVVIYYV